MVLTREVLGESVRRSWAGRRLRWVNVGGPHGGPAVVQRPPANPRTSLGPSLVCGGGGRLQSSARLLSLPRAGRVRTGELPLHPHRRPEALGQRWLNASVRAGAGGGLGPGGPDFQARAWGQMFSVSAPLSLTLDKAGAAQAGAGT